MFRSPTFVLPLCACALVLGVLAVGCDEPKKDPPPPPAPPVAAVEGQPKREPKAKPVPEEITVTASNPEAVTMFKRGRYLVENARIDEGVAEIQKAVTLDKTFPLALAYLGFFTPTDEGMMMLERAVSLSSGLPKAERLYVEHLLTWRRGDQTVLLEQRKSLAQLAGNDWRIQYELGEAAREERNWSEAESRFNAAISLNENAGAAFNMLGLTLIEQGKFDQAVTALKKYAEQLPKEPTPHDTLGEAQLRAGKLDDAQAHFSKAAELVPSYTQAWFGVAQCHFLKGEAAKGREALDSAAKHAAGPTAALEAMNFKVWSLMAEKDWKGALAAVDQLEKVAKAARDGRSYAHGSVLRAAVSSESGKHAVVDAQVATAISRAQSAQLAGDALSEIIGSSHIWKIRSQLQLKKVAAAEQSVELLGKAIMLAPGPRTLSLRSHANGLISVARGDKEIAVQQLLECTESDYLCRMDLYRQQRESDPATAQKTLKALTESPRRDPLFLYAWSRLKTEGSAAAVP